MTTSRDGLLGSNAVLNQYRNESVELNLIVNKYSSEQQLLWNEHDACQEKFKEFLKENDKFLDFAKHCNKYSNFLEKTTMIEIFSLNVMQIMLFLKRHVDALQLISEQHAKRFFDYHNFFESISKSIDEIKCQVDKIPIDPAVVSAKLRDFVNELNFVSTKVMHYYKEKSNTLLEDCLLVLRTHKETEKHQAHLQLLQEQQKARGSSGCSVM